MTLGRWWGAALAAVSLTAGAARADLGSLTADEAVRIALQDNSSVYNAARLVEQARGALFTAQTSVLPQVSGSGSVSYGKNSTVIAGIFIPTQTAKRQSTSISANLNLLNLETWSAIKQAARSLDASKASAEDTRQVVALAVRQQFYALVRAKLIAHVSEGTARVDSSNLALTDALFEVGTAPKTDVLKARTTKSQGDLALITARHTVDLERLRLASLLGLADDRGIDVVETLAEAVDVGDSTSLTARALEARPDIKALEYQIGASQASVSGAKFSRFPSIGFGADASKSKNTTTDSAETRVSKPSGWSVSGQVNVPITDWIYGSGRIKQRRALLDIDRRNLVQKRADVALEVRQAWLALQEARDRLGVAHEQLDYAQQSYELTREKYRLGSSTILELTTAEVEQTRSQSDLVDARVGLQLAKAQLDKAIGLNP